MSCITRRDFLNGIALATPLAGQAFAATSQAPNLSERTGLQGQTDMVNAVAHGRRDRPEVLDSQAAELDPQVEDLVVVGAGLSGLTGAYLFRKHAERPVKVLLLDALDDVGGHARRNEFVSRSGRLLVGYGGSQSLDSPGLFSPAVHGVLADLGIDLARFKSEFFDSGWSARHGLVGKGLYFPQSVWGKDSLVRKMPDESAVQWVKRTPLSVRAQRDLEDLLTSRRNVLPGLHSRLLRRDLLARITYAEFLRTYWRVDESIQTWFQRDTCGYFGVGIDATTALDAWAGGLPGFGGLDLGEAMDTRMSPSARQLMASQDDYVYHFPDGNAGVARALIRSLIPGALSGNSMESLADAVLDYARLDEPDGDVRLRLGATVVGLRHLGPPHQAQHVELRYVDRGGTLRLVRARQVILACWHRVIARMTDELPASQTAALNDQVKTPLLYANVLLSNWRAFQRAGIQGLSPVGGFWDEATLDFPVSMGSVKFPGAADEPILMHLAKVVVPGNGAPPRAQASQGRVQLQAWSFDYLERQIREMLQGALGEFGFNAMQDIEAITINRWAHGYAYEYMCPWDPYWPRGALPCHTARRGWGRVAIANSDAGAYAYAHSAIDQATRAVHELLPNAKLPGWRTVPGPEPAEIGLQHPH